MRLRRVVLLGKTGFLKNLPRDAAGDIDRPLLARQSPAAKIPFQTRRG
jgi:hypothetical protein